MDFDRPLQSMQISGQLGSNQDDRRCDQEGFDSHVDQSVIVLGASLVWMVLKTRWPVKDA
jgi:hypothetical protein